LVYWFKDGGIITANIDYYKNRKGKRMAVTTSKLKDYLNKNQTIILATVGIDGAPDIRTIGGFGINDFTVYISTAKDSNKVKQLEKENKVALFFQQDNEFISSYFNATIFGKAEVVNTEAEFDKGKALILNRKPHLNILKETHQIYKIIPESIKTVDIGEKKPEERVSVLKF
jgi:uncharacterized pyridoxamine 5'-phosphate oxidase family protein